jgi:hypothetical protein
MSRNLKLKAAIKEWSALDTLSPERLMIIREEYEESKIKPAWQPDAAELERRRQLNAATQRRWLAKHRDERNARRREQYKQARSGDKIGS